MVFGVWPENSVFRSVCLGLAMISLSSAIYAQEPDEKENKAQAKPLSGFDLLDAYRLKVNKFKEFQEDRALQDTNLQQRKSRAADELNRVIGGIELLMQQEGERLYQQAMSASDLEERDKILKRLAKTNHAQLQDVRLRAERHLEHRTVGEKVYPTIQAAEEAERQAREKQRKKFAELEQKDLKDLETIKGEELTGSISKAAQEFAEQDAQQMFDTAVRLVWQQRRERLKEIARKYPMTKAGQEAHQVLIAIQHQNEAVANRKLHAALMSPVVFDQRFRRLKEIIRDHAGTNAALEAEQIFQQHALQIPPVGISNHSASEVEMTVDQPYGKMQRAKLYPGETRSYPAAFPLMIRVKIDESEYRVYRALAGWNYNFQSAPDHTPVLYPVK